MPDKRRAFIRRHIKDYCEDSSLAAVKYVVAKDRPLFEKAWWMIAILCNFLLSLYLMKDVWVKWNDSPVIVSFAEKSTPVWEIPFPAITICSKNKVRRSVFNFTQYYKMKDRSKLTDEEIEKLSTVELLCDRGWRRNYFGESMYIINQSRINFLEEVAENIFLGCSWQDENVFRTCKNFFTPVITDEGYCFTSNSLEHLDFYRNGMDSKYLKSLRNGTHWNLERGYDEGADLFTTYPRRVISSGIKFGLRIFLEAFKSDFDVECSGISRGFKVTLHNPAEVASVSNRFLNVPLNQEVFLAVKPNMMTTSSNLQNYSPERRQCYFAHERKLAFFKVYTQKNCWLECQTNHTLKECGCVQFYMPKANDTPICGQKSQECAISYHEKITAEINSALDNKIGRGLTCNCLQSCTSLEYEAEVSQGGSFNIEDIEYMMPTREKYSYSFLTIYFKDPEFIAGHRSELYGLSDFVGACGGLLGLTNGFCILSLFEIIYYLTLRLYSNYYYYQEKKKRNDTGIENQGERNL